MRSLMDIDRSGVAVSQDLQVAGKRQTRKNGPYEIWPSDGKKKKKTPFRTKTSAFIGFSPVRDPRHDATQTMGVFCVVSFGSVRRMAYTTMAL